MSKNATLIIDGNSYEFPIIEGTEKEQAIDIKTLRGVTGGVTTIDPGYKNTGSCESAITFLDGEQGILRYRGYSIEELAEKADFLEVAYLLIFGEQMYVWVQTNSQVFATQEGRSSGTR